MGHAVDADSHAGLCTNLKKAGLIMSLRVQDAFRATDRKFFVPPEHNPYTNRPQPLDVAGATISTPQIHAIVAELLADVLMPGARVCDIGSGSGFLTVLFGHMVRGRGGRVFGVEHSKELVLAATSNATAARRDLVDEGVVSFLVGNGMRGLAEKAPFDAIHVGAAIPDVMTKSILIRQLKPGGRLVAPLGPAGGEQQLIVAKRSPYGTRVDEESVMSVVFSPLTPSPAAASRPRETRAHKLARLKRELDDWRAGFEAKHGRRPTREDMFTDPAAASLFQAFASMHKNWGAPPEGAGAR